MSTDDVASAPTGDSHTKCLLDNLPEVPTKHQIETLDSAQSSWLVFAAVIPFVILVLIGGWRDMFQSGDASAYVLGAVVVCFVESIFQQREDNFETLKRYWSRSSYWGPRFSVRLGAFVGVTVFIWNIYFAIHDRHVGTPSVDWVQILVFFISLLSLPGVRFTATPYSGEAEWSDPLRKRIDHLHSRATKFARDAEKYRIDDRFLRGYFKLEAAKLRFEAIDDFWCASQADDRALELLKQRQTPVPRALFILLLVRHLWS
jgi:hypothetical protein